MYVILGKYKMVWLLEALLNDLDVTSSSSLLVLGTKLPLLSSWSLAPVISFPTDITCIVCFQAPSHLWSLYTSLVSVVTPCEALFPRDGCINKTRTTAPSMYIAICGSRKFHRVPPLPKEQQATLAGRRRTSFSQGGAPLLIVQ